MQFNDLVFFIVSGFMAFVIYKFMYVFYLERRASIWIEVAVYCLYFVLLATIHTLIPIPLLRILINLLGMFLCTQLYVGSIKKAILATLIICASLTVIETLIVFLSSLKEIDPIIPFYYKSIFGLILIRILSYMFVLALNGIKNVKRQHSLPTAYWVSLFAIPSISLCMLISVFVANETSNELVLVCIIGAIIINVLTFDLYDKVSKLIYKQMGDRLIAEQTVYYEKQLQMMKSLLDQMRILRHDLSNKLSPLLALSQESDMEKLQAAIQEILQYSRSDKSLVNSGNRDIDSILNFKLESGKQQGLKISTDIIVPNAMEIESSDLAVILGNIIDNALEATLTVSDRWISVQIRYSKGRLIMEVVNSYDGIVKTDRDKLMTRKKERKDHGFGLNSVERVVDKYDGLIQTTYDDKTFKTKVLIYV